MANVKPTVITFKVDETLADALRGVPNRSAFIRSAILAALDNTCPLCRGTGIMTPEQRSHWERFSQTHGLEECGECHAFHLVCELSGQGAQQTHEEGGHSG